MPGYPETPFFIRDGYVAYGDAEWPTLSYWIVPGMEETAHGEERPTRAQALFDDRVLERFRANRQPEDHSFSRGFATGLIRLIEATVEEKEEERRRVKDRFSFDITHDAISECRVTFR